MLLCSMMHIFFFLMIRRPPRSTLFPYTTPSDLRDRATQAEGCQNNEHNRYSQPWHASLLASQGPFTARKRGLTSSPRRHVALLHESPFNTGEVDHPAALDDPTTTCKRPHLPGGHFCGLFVLCDRHFGE